MDYNKQLEKLEELKEKINSSNNLEEQIKTYKEAKDILKELKEELYRLEKMVNEEDIFIEI